MLYDIYVNNRGKAQWPSSVMTRWNSCGNRKCNAFQAIGSSTNTEEIFVANGHCSGSNTQTSCRHQVSRLGGIRLTWLHQLAARSAWKSMWTNKAQQRAIAKQFHALKGAHSDVV